MSVPRVSVAAAALLVLAGNAVGQETAPPSGAVRVTVGAVLASNRSTEVDARLAAVREQISSFFSYSSYRLVDEQQRRVDWGARAGFDVPGGRHVSVVPRHLRRDHIVLKLEITDGQRSVVDTQVALRDHGTFLIGGQRQPDGQVILAIGAERVE